VSQFEEYFGNSYIRFELRDATKAGLIGI